MATPLLDQYKLSQTEEARSLAKIKLDNTFTPKAQSAFNLFSTEIVPYIMDYFILSDDLRMRVGMDEEFRRCYHDYSFLVFPVQKAFESYAAAVLSFVFQFKITKEKNGSIGYYLHHFSEENKKEAINKLAKKFPKVNHNRWLNMWNALGLEWVDNRNPFIHPEQQILTFRQAEQISSSIISQMRSSIELIMPDILDPLFEVIKKRKEKEEIKPT
jgi:hypothetical protein